MMTFLLTTRGAQKPSQFNALARLTLLCCALSSLPVHASSTLDKAHSQAQQMLSEGQASQQRINQSIDETQSLESEFRQVANSLEQININLSHQQQVYQQQQAQIASLSAQLDAVSDTEDSLVPLMLKMLDWLELHIEADLPFHLTERKKRIAKLKANILSPSMPLAEIYRSLLDAYQIENEFAYNIESYQQSIQLNAQPIESQILRIGRIGLYYLTLDGTHGGFWDRQTGQWQAADPATLKAIELGILIAKKQRPHSLLALPLSLGDQP